MRVAVDARALGAHFPGIGRATRGLLYGLQAIEHQEEFIVLHRPQHRDQFEAIGLADDDRFQLHPWPDDPLGLTQQWNGPRLARHFKPNVWHAPYYFRPLYGLPPTIVTVFDTIGLGPPVRVGSSSTGGRARRGPRQVVWHWAMHASLGTARHVVTASEAARRDLQRLYDVPAGRLSVVPLATEPHFGPPDATAIARIQTTYALPERYVLYLGSNKPHKNLVALIEAWALVVRKASGVGLPLLVVAGREDPRYPEARQRVAERGLDEHVRFVPDVPDEDLPAMIGGALVFVFPSLHEGFGFPPLEAMAVGTPVVSSNRPSLPEVIGDGGLLVDPEPAALAAGMHRLLADEAFRSMLRARGFERAAQFSWERTARTMLELYHGIA